jgi:hypothetical protein
VQWPDLAARYKADLEVIGVQRLLQMQGIDDAGDLQHFTKAVAAMRPVDRMWVMNPSILPLADD